MASLPKRKRLTKSQRKKLNSEKGKKSVDSRGKGLGSRKDFSLPFQWETEVKENLEEFADVYFPGQDSVSIWYGGEGDPFQKGNVFGVL